ncbi:hypothetical protein CI102_15289 [Trichoderma harzianum]|uniref:Uncharacterized protein n=1 Tax=Trichoderma harzianum CBS 226.95 TaxID=983964 RepID=A0A2T4ADQ4_TRIHA|nr:hypothetical protein M431DRAFT_438533 [Trichoderma harzianum CBS 226.95]PKK36585.1 hypothetical protein CI102_15289 [Trichoderma harzianum]PTB55176.1 hypothetical protein M431DRAFT_438533 [Trichoderma harzianum CBS 226.95]
MDVSKLLQICHLWGTASQGQLFTVHGRIGSLALVHRQMITTMIAGILASVSLGQPRSMIQHYRPTSNRETQEGVVCDARTARSPGDWASTGLQGPGEREISKTCSALSCGQNRSTGTSQASQVDPHAAGPLPMTPAAAGEDYMRALFLGTGPW